MYFNRKACKLIFSVNFNAFNEASCTIAARFADCSEAFDGVEVEVESDENEKSKNLENLSMTMGVPKYNIATIDSAKNMDNKDDNTTPTSSVFVM